MSEREEEEEERERRKEEREKREGVVYGARRQKKNAPQIRFMAKRNRG